MSDPLVRRTTAAGRLAAVVSRNLRMVAQATVFAVRVGLLVTATLAVGALAATAVAPSPESAGGTGGDLPMLEVVAALEGRFPGDVVEAEIESRGGRRVYEVELRDAAGNLTKVVADARTGEVLEARAEQDEAYVLRVSGAIVPLDMIVTDAQGRFAAELLEVELEDEDGRYVYELELVAPDGTVMEVLYDATSGNLIQVEDD